MFKNRFLIVLGLLSLLLVAMAVALPPANAPAISAIQRGREAYAARWTAMGEYYQNQAEAAEAEASTVDSATRSYIAWGQAMQARNAMDSATRSYIARGEALEKAKLNALDSGTRSYIAWGEALEAAAKLGESGVCSTTSQENIFAGIDSSLDSATRSYIAWGLALQAKNDIRACH